VCLKLGS